MKRALLSDYGGVLTLSLRSGLADACRSVGADPARFGDILRHRDGDPLVGVETGRIDWDSFTVVLVEVLTEAGGSDVDIDTFVGTLMASCPPDGLICDAVRNLRAAGVPIALVSNSWNVDHYLREITGLFDVELYSSTFGSRKPEDAIYLAAAERLGVGPQDCVMIDDFAVNIETANRLGMTGILHEGDSAGTVAELERLFGIALRSSSEPNGGARDGPR